MSKKLPAEVKENLLKLDIMQNIGTAYVVLKPGALQYKVNFKGAGGQEMGCEVSVLPPSNDAEAKVEGGAEGDNPVLSAEAKPEAEVAAEGEPINKEAKGSAVEAKDYLESHKVLEVVQAMLQCIIKEKPSDPFAFISQTMLNGVKLDELKSVAPAKAASKPKAEPKAEPKGSAREKDAAQGAEYAEALTAEEGADASREKDAAQSGEWAEALAEEAADGIEEVPKDEEAGGQGEKVLEKEEAHVLYQ